MDKRTRLILSYMKDGNIAEEIIDMTYYNIEDIFATLYHSFKGDKITIQDQDGNQQEILKADITSFSLMMFPEPAEAPAEAPETAQTE